MVEPNKLKLPVKFFSVFLNIASGENNVTSFQEIRHFSFFPCKIPGGSEMWVTSILIERLEVRILHNLLVVSSIG